MSASQLDTLLRYDSPPETPIEPTAMHFCHDKQYNFDERSEGERLIDLDNSIMHLNREPLPSQLESQFDFSTFHNVPGNMNDISQSWSLPASIKQDEDNNKSVTIHTPDIDHITLDNNEKFEERKSHNSVNIENINDDSMDVDCILDNIDFEQISKIEKAYWSKIDVSKSFPTQCQTRPELNKLKTNERVVASCPAPVIEHSPLDAANVLQFNYANIFKPSKTLDELFQSKLLETRHDLSNDINNGQAKDNVFKYSFRQGLTQDESDIFKRNEGVETSCLTPFKESSQIYCCSTHATNLTQFDYANYSISPPSSTFEHFKMNSSMTHAKDTNQHLFTLPKTIPVKENTTENVESATVSGSQGNTIINTMIDITMLPSSVKQLYDIVKAEHSDFAFIYTLSAQLCQDRIPMECFITLKMALLLSLTSIGPNSDCCPIPIVAIGNDTYMTDYLMRNVGQLGTRFVGPTDDSKPPSNGYRNHNWIEADPILLAKGGVYYAGDWSRFKLRRAENLFRDIESASVSVDKLNRQYPLETAIWTHWRSFKNNAKDQEMFNKFVKIFGIPIFVSDDHHESLVNYTLEQASIRVFESTVDHLSISSEDMRSFLVHVSQQNVYLSPQAALVLQQYFVASRAARQECLTKQAYVMLKQFSESFAKLSLRKEVLLIDALAAIILCEHFIENIFGSSDNAPPHFGEIPLIVSAVDDYMDQFQQWLDSYIEKYAKK